MFFSFSTAIKDKISFESILNEFQSRDSVLLGSFSFLIVSKVSVFFDSREEETAENASSAALDK